MSDKKVTDIMLDRIKYFVNAIENGEYEPNGYEFTISLKLPYNGLPNLEKEVIIADQFYSLFKSNS